MNEVVVKFLAALLGVSEEDAKKAIEAEDAKEAEGLFKTFEDGHKIFTNEEHETLLKNAGKEHLDKLVASNDKIPNDLYNKVKGIVLETTEKNLAKEHGYEDEHEGLTDLVSKLVEKAKADADTGEGDEGLKNKIKELEDRVTELKETVKTNDEDWQSKLKEAEGETNQYIVDDVMKRAVNALNYDVPEDGLAEMQELVLATFKNKYQVERVEGVVLVKDSEGNVLKDKVGEAIPVSTVVKENLPSFVKLKDSSGGGRGAGSPDVTANSDLSSIKTMEQFEELVAKKGYEPMSNEAADLLIEVKKESPDFKTSE